MEKRKKVDKMIINDGGDNIVFEKRPYDDLVIIRFQEPISYDKSNMLLKRIVAIKKHSDWNGGVVILNNTCDIMGVEDIKFRSIMRFYIVSLIQKMFKHKPSTKNIPIVPGMNLEDALNGLAKISKVSAIK